MAAATDPTWTVRHWQQADALAARTAPLHRADVPMIAAGHAATLLDTAAFAASASAA